LVSADDSETTTTGNIIGIIDSGTMRMTKGERDYVDDDEEEEQYDETEDEELQLYNTDSEPHRRTLSHGDSDDSITVNST
jgi:hypothetical protein